ncbi:hypothetical protein AAVH_07798 [Aphelenchoides avenae]|nr:hypothetical protein AAVH_07798 [Aphelenchus avenae]
MATGDNGGGTVPVTTTTVATTTTTAQCAAMDGQVLLFTDPTFTSGSSAYGEVAPTSTCITCAAGSENYYPDSGEPVIMAVNEAAIAGVTCTNMCLCNRATGVCYTRGAGMPNVVLYPYCNAGTCTTYVYIVGDDADSIVGTDGSSFTAASQIDTASPTLSPFPVTMEGVYPTIDFASCNGCNVPRTCA